MEKIMTIYMKRDGKIKYDMGKGPKPVFKLIGLLCLVAEDLARTGYDLEIERGKKKNGTGN